VGERIRVLVVEDLEDDLELLLLGLRHGGFDVTHERVVRADEMRAALRQRAWDIVISDFALPSFGALEALAVLKESGQDLPFIVLSGTIGEERAVEALRQGAHDFVVKQQLARLVPAVRRELREAEGRRRRRSAEAELARSEALLRSILDNVPEGVLVADEHGRFLVWNSAADELFGRGPSTRPPEEWPDEYGLMLEDQVTPHPWETQPLVRAIRGESVDGHVEFVRREGRAGALVSCNARPLVDEQGAVHGGVALLRDITLERAAQEQLMLSDRMASVGLLAAGVAHEINNPLSAVIANLDLLHETISETGQLDAMRWQELREQLSDAREAADRVRRIVKDLKVLSRSEEVKTSRVDVRELLDASLRMAHNEIRHRARITRSFRAVPVVEANPSRLGQVFLNLLINAAQAIRPGHADANHIVVATDTDERGRAVIEVRDTGAGMPLEVRQHIFTPFFTTKPIGVGTGLGLSICHRIVTQLGGEITVESEVGVGSTFRVALPADPSAVADPPTSMPAIAAALRRGRVLVIDDEEIVLNAVRRTLSSEHDVVTVSESPAALAWIEAGERFDVIICDLMMPVMTGIDLFAAIQRVAPELATRVVFFTGGAFTDEGRAFLERVDNISLDKPFEPQQLRALVNARVR
jgi:signal transduction histidine kinase/DNA-binding response OmpR family regulator